MSETAADVAADEEVKADELKKFELPLMQEDGAKLELKDYDWKEWEKSGGVMLEENFPSGSLVGVEAKVKEDSNGAVAEFKKLEDQSLPTEGAHCYPKLIPVPPVDLSEPTPKKALLPIVTVLLVRMDEVIHHKSEATPAE